MVPHRQELHLLSQSTDIFSFMVFFSSSPPNRPWYYRRNKVGYKRIPRQSYHRCHGILRCTRVSTRFPKIRQSWETTQPPEDKQNVFSEQTIAQFRIEWLVAL